MIHFLLVEIWLILVDALRLSDMPTVDTATEPGSPRKALIYENLKPSRSFHAFSMRFLFRYLSSMYTPRLPTPFGPLPLLVHKEALLIVKCAASVFFSGL